MCNEGEQGDAMGELLLREAHRDSPIACPCSPSAHIAEALYQEKEGPGKPVKRWVFDGHYTSLSGSSGIGPKEYFVPAARLQIVGSHLSISGTHDCWPDSLDLAKGGSTLETPAVNVGSCRPCIVQASMPFKMKP
ncbi:unnamed protein product [Leuciscus chuanchicus]